jgi:hypothetical protein
MQYEEGSAAAPAALLGVSPRMSQDMDMIDGGHNAGWELASGTLARARETRALPPNPNCEVTA